jgi:hypothetical protein
MVSKRDLSGLNIATIVAKQQARCIADDLDFASNSRTQKISESVYGIYEKGVKSLKKKTFSPGKRFRLHRSQKTGLVHLESEKVSHPLDSDVMSLFRSESTCLHRSVVSCYYQWSWPRRSIRFAVELTQSLRRAGSSSWPNRWLRTPHRYMTQSTSRGLIDNNDCINRL